MTSKEDELRTEKHQNVTAHESNSNHSEKREERLLDYVWTAAKTTFIVYIICTIIVAIVLAYCGFSIYHAPLLTIGLMLVLFMIGYC